MHRTFGFELEVKNPGRLATRLYRKHLTLSATVHEYHCECPNCYEYFGRADAGVEDEYGEFRASSNMLKVQYDSSCGGEVISSPLRLSEGYVNQLTDEIERAIAGSPDGINPIRTDASCGFHVHVGVSDLTDGQLSALAELALMSEAVLYRLACGHDARHRQEGDYGYARPLSWYLRNQPEALEELLSERVNDSHIQRNDKYVMVNFRPLNRQGTVEFRLFNAPREAWLMRFYVMLSVAMVERATMPLPRPMPAMGALGSFTRGANAFKRATKAARWLLRTLMEVPGIPPEFEEMFWRQWNAVPRKNCPAGVRVARRPPRRQQESIDYARLVIGRHDSMTIANPSQRRSAAQVREWLLELDAGGRHARQFYLYAVNQDTIIDWLLYEGVEISVVGPRLSVTESGGRPFNLTPDGLAYRVPNVEGASPAMRRILSCPNPFVEGCFHQSLRCLRLSDDDGPRPLEPESDPLTASGTLGASGEGDPSGNTLPGGEQPELQDVVLSVSTSSASMGSDEHSVEPVVTAATNTEAPSHGHAPLG